MTKTISPADFRTAMGRFPGVVTIVTTCSEHERYGITATAVSSVSAEPPSLLVCLNKATGTCAMVQKTGLFTVNLLGEPDDDLAMRFAGAHGVNGPEKFAQGQWVDDERGLPVLEDALVSLSCTVSEVLEAGSHMVFIGTIDAVRFGEGQPLLYEQSGFRGLMPLSA